jgi:hypothetical protein
MTEGRDGAFMYSNPAREVINSEGSEIVRYAYRYFIESGEPIV